MKYLRRELNQVEKEYLKQFGEDSLNRVILHDPNTKDKQEVQDTIDILKEAIAKIIQFWFTVPEYIDFVASVFDNIEINIYSSNTFLSIHF